MVDIDDINGWKSGGALSGDDIYEIIGTNTETGGVLHIKISGPTEFQPTTYSVAVQKPGEVFPETWIAQGLKDATKAELKALNYAQDN